MRRFFAAAFLSLTILSPASAQAPGAAMDAVNAAQDSEISAADAKAQGAVDRNAAQDQNYLDLIDLVEKYRADLLLLKGEVNGLTAITADHESRIKALEAGGGTPPPDPTPVLPVISIDVTPQSGDEGASFTFTLTRTGDLSAPSSVSYAAFGEADAADFVGGVISSGIVSFAPGDQAATLTVGTNDDAEVEPDESFAVALSAPVGATLGASSVTATIINNDSNVPPPAGPVVSLDPAQRFQAISGWEVTTRTWEQDKVNDRYDPSWLADRDELIADLVNEAGVNRVRLEVQSGAENPVDYWGRFVAGQDSYTTFQNNYYNNVNDNADPASANAPGFQWSQLDYRVDNIVLPMRAALADRGETLYVNLTIVDFGKGNLGTLSLAASPAEYAEFVTEAFLHLKAKYGFEPDALEIALEPENGSSWNATQIANAIKAAKARLAGAGFSPAIIAPSVMRASNAVSFSNRITDLGTSFDVLAYHTYDNPPDSTRSAILAKATAMGAETAMLERTGADINQFYRDATIANVSAWQQWGLASKTDNGNYLLFAEPAKPAGQRISLADKTRNLSQVWRHVRQGSVRIGASSSASALKPMAFERPDGGAVVAVIASGATSFTVSGLAPGNYRIERTTAAVLHEGAGSVKVGANGLLPVSIPAAGVVTVFEEWQPPPTGAIQPASDGSRPVLQLGLNHHRDWSGENAYASRTNYYDASMFGGAAKIAADEFDPFTGILTVKPGESFTLRQIRQLQTEGHPEIDAGLWDVCYEVSSGTASVDAPGLSTGLKTGNEICKFIDLSPTDTGARQLVVTGNGDVRVTYVGPAKFKGQGHPWHPSFLKYVSGHDIIRPMDWVAVINATITEADDWLQDGSYIAQDGSQGWQAMAANEKKRKAGYRFDLMFDLAARTGTAVHLNVPITLGGEIIKPEIRSGGAAMQNALKANFAAVMTAAENEQYLLSKHWLTSKIKAGYLNSTAIIVEPGNELWNSNFKKSFDYAVAIGAAASGSNNAGFGAGYYGAAMAHGVDRAKAEIDPGQPIVYLIGCQTSNVTLGNFCEQALKGWGAYNATIRDGVPLSQLLLGTTGYYGGAVFAWNAKKSPGNGNPFGSATEAEYVAAFQAADQAGTLNADIKRWALDPASGFDSVEQVISWHNSLIALAKKYGARGLTQYEGGNHMNAQPNGLLAKNYPASRQAFINYITSPEAADVQREMIRQLRALPSINTEVATSGWLPGEMPISNYEDVGRYLSIDQPWVERSADEINSCPQQGAAAAFCETMRGAH